MSGPPSDRRARGPENAADDDSKTRVKSIGEVASPLLAGFSFTNVIVIVMSNDAEHFLLPGEAVISWTIASIAFIVTVQFAKYAADGEKRYEGRTEICYHLGVLTFLIGFGFALAPKSGAEEYVFRWIASGIAFAAFISEAFVYGRRKWRAWQQCL